MNETIYYGEHSYEPIGERIGQEFELSYAPRMAGNIVGYNASLEWWLVELTVPYGANSGVYVVLPEDFLQAAEKKAKAAETRAKRQEAGRKPHKRGFSSMNKEDVARIASMGGKAAHEKGTAHKWTSDEAQAAGKKGGAILSQNREHMVEIGRKGGSKTKEQFRAKIDDDLNSTR